MPCAHAVDNRTELPHDRIVLGIRHGHLPVTAGTPVGELAVPEFLREEAAFDGRPRRYLDQSGRSDTRVAGVVAVQRDR